MPVMNTPLGGMSWASAAALALTFWIDDVRRATPAGFFVIALAERLQPRAQADEDRRADVVHRDVGDDDVLERAAVDAEDLDAAVARVADLAVADADVLEPAVAIRCRA